MANQEKPTHWYTPAIINLDAMKNTMPTLSREQLVKLVYQRTEKDLKELGIALKKLGRDDGDIIYLYCKLGEKYHLSFQDISDMPYHAFKGYVQCLVWDYEKEKRLSQPEKDEMVAGTGKEGVGDNIISTGNIINSNVMFPGAGTNAKQEQMLLSKPKAKPYWNTFYSIIGIIAAIITIFYFFKDIIISFFKSSV